MNRSKLIVRLIGGLGNQMFGYAAARRLAMSNDSELVIDSLSGFVRDLRYRRSYSLEPFTIAGRLATANEMFIPLERYRRALVKWRERPRSFDRRRYITQDGQHFEQRLLERRVNGKTLIEGVWPSENYFADVADQIRLDFSLKAEPQGLDAELARQMASSNSVAVHLRFFKTDVADTTSNINVDYYLRALEMVRDRVGAARFFIFSDRPAEAAQKLGLNDSESTIVCHHDEKTSHLDMWLMSQCRHAIIANSTFSWWGAWLGDVGGVCRLVIAPDPNRYPGMGWSSERLLPDRWLKC